MALRSYVPVDAANLPESFEYEIDGTTYQLTFDYNDEGNYFTVDIATYEGDMIVRGEKLVADRPLWVNVFDDRLPTTPLVPMDESGVSTYCGIDEFMKTMFLYEDDIDPNDEDNPSPIDVDDDDEEGDLIG